MKFLFTIFLFVLGSLSLALGFSFHWVLDLSSSPESAIIWLIGFTSFVTIGILLIVGSFELSHN